MLSASVGLTKIAGGLYCTEVGQVPPHEALHVPGSAPMCPGDM